MKRTLLLAIAILTPALLLGCKNGKESLAPTAPPAGTPLSYAEVATAYNSRIERLPVFWASGIVSIRYTDRDGDRQYEQGNVNLNTIAPDLLSLRVKKLGETLMHLGADGDRYWLFNLIDERVALSGAVDAATPEKVAAMGLVVPPDQLMTLVGLRGLPPETPGARAIKAGQTIFVETASTGERWRFEIDANTYEPQRIGWVNSAGKPVLWAALEDYREVDLTGTPLPWPKVSSIMRIYDDPSDSQLTITLDRLRGREPRSRSIFSYTGLLDALSPIDQEIDIDQELAP